MLKSLKCWQCKKNTGNRTCEKYPEGIPFSVPTSPCDEYDVFTTWAEYEQVKKKGIDTYFKPVEWENEKPQNPRKAFVL